MHVPGVGVGSGSGSSGKPAGQGAENCLGEELNPDLALGGSEGAAQADLRAAFRHGDDHDVGHAYGTAEQGDRAAGRRRCRTISRHTQIRSPGKVRLMPRSWVAATPRAVTGSRMVAALK